MIETERLILRRWREEDLGSFAALNADPEVTEHFERPLRREESDAVVGQLEDHFDRHGVGEWAIERRFDRAFLGMAGLAILTPHFPVGPGFEIGYRFARHAWGAGYASEASRAALAYGFGKLGLEEVVAFTAVPNLRSQAVMKRIGMVHEPARDFDHPALPEGHRLRRHVLFAIRS